MALKEFQAESRRLMDLMINSIYTHKEIFLRELVSNASDAIDKLYYRTLEEGATGLSRDDFSIRIDLDKEARTLALTDNGIGMTQEELDQNLGVIARSGSLQFKTEKGQKDGVDIIGQFGVGFYSAFMVSKRVRVESRAFGAGEAWQWESSGLEGYEVTPCERAGHGTTITLWLKDDTEDEKYSEFCEPYRVRQLIKRYSDYIRYPIRMGMEKSRLKEGTGTDGKDPEYEAYFETETLNSMVPIWKKAKSEVSDEELHAFYKEKFFDWQDPLRVTRTSAEGAATYSALLFIPKTAPMDYYTREFEKGLQLYASGVLIMDKCADLLPDCFSFVRGLVDSQDLSLNISREMLQHDRQLKLIAGRLEKKIASDLVLFTSSKDEKLVTLAEYAGRMPEGQPAIYYGCGETAGRILSLPQAEAILEKGYEVLCLTDNVDEFALRVLEKYDGKEFKNISADGLDLETDEEKERARQVSDSSKDMLAAMKGALEGKVKDVRVSLKLKSHPVCISTEGMVSTEMEKVLNAMPAQEKVKAQRVLELNPGHPVFEKLCALAGSDKDRLALYAEILYDQALLIEGIALEDPAGYVRKVCSIL